MSGNVASGSPDHGNPVKVGAVYNSTLPTYSTGQRADLQVGSRGALKVELWQSDNANPVVTNTGDADGQAAQRGLQVASYAFVLNGSTWDRATKPNATHRLLSAAASTNATSVKASAGNVHRIIGENTNAAKRYLKLYNKANAPTVGTDTPVLTFVLQATAAFNIDLGTYGQYFSTGIAYALTTAAADADTGALTAGDVACMNITYS